MERAAGVKSFRAQSSVKSEAIFNNILKLSDGRLEKVNSAMSDSVKMNSGRLTGINKRLSKIIKTLGYRIHTLECF